jgi:hypothetical protein
MIETIKVGERYRLERLAAGDYNAIFETNELDQYDLDNGGDGIVYASTAKEAVEIREQNKG